MILRSEKRRLSGASEACNYLNYGTTLCVTSPSHNGLFRLVVCAWLWSIYVLINVIILELVAHGM